MGDFASARRAPLRRSYASLLCGTAVLALLLFPAAGALRWWRAWVFLGVFTAQALVATTVLWRVSPEVSAARSRIQAGTKRVDYLFIAILVAAFFLIFPVAGLDYRLGSVRMSNALVWLGYGLFTLSFAAGTWAQAVNRHFEPGVRIQADRGHAVVDVGPYSVVRHPGYISGAVFGVATALCLGSIWALAPALVMVVALIPRTLFEERTLTSELPGYRDYARRVKYRWVPGLW